MPERVARPRDPDLNVRTLVESGTATEACLHSDVSADSAKRDSYKKVIAYALLALLIFTAVAIVLTYPLAANMSHNYFNPSFSHDGVGTIWLTWYSNFARAHSYTGNVTTFVAYPFGYNTRAIYYPLTNGVLVLMARVIGAQASYNLLTLSTFPLAGLLMFLLLYYITSSPAASILGGFIYAFSPWHTARTFDQVGLAQIYVLPLFLIAVIYFWRRRSVISAAAVSGALLVAILTDFHLGLFCGLLLITWGVAVFLRERADSKRFLRLRRPLVKRETVKAIVMAALAVVLALAIAAPVLQNLFYKDPLVITPTEERSIDVTVSYSSRPWNYVVPPAYALLWRWWTNDFVTKHEGKSGVHEVTAYPGIVTFVMACFAVYFTFRRKKKPRPASEGAVGDDDAPPDEAVAAPPGDDLEHDAKIRGGMDLARTTVYFGAITAVIAFILSMPPVVKIGSVQIPTPSIVMRAIAPFFRFYSRWALVVTFSLALMAGIGLFMLARSRRWSGFRVGAVCLALIALFALDVTIIPPLRSRDIAKVPTVVTELSNYPRKQPVAVYPLSPGRYFIPLQYDYFQTFHQHPMLNGSKPGTLGDLYQAVLKDLYAPYTPEMLKGLGIDKVMVIDGYWEIMYPVGLKFDPAMMPPGYRLVKKTRDGYLYDVTGPAAQVFPLYYTNFTAPAILQDGKAWTVMTRPNAEMLIDNRDGPTVQNFSVTFNNPGEEGTFSIALDGVAIGQTRLGPGQGELLIPGMKIPAKQHVMSIQWEGKPTKIDGRPFGPAGDISDYLMLTRPRFSASGI